MTDFSFHGTTIPFNTSTLLLFTNTNLKESEYIMYIQCSMYFRHQLSKHGKNDITLKRNWNEQTARKYIKLICGSDYIVRQRAEVKMGGKSFPHGKTSLHMTKLLILRTKKLFLVKDFLLIKEVWLDLVGIFSLNRKRRWYL